MRSGSLRQNPRVGPSVKRDALEGVPYAVEILERARHRAAARSAGENKRAVDVEQKNGFQTSPRTLPARGPLGDGSSSKLTRCPSLS
jgi:hypothetical protein